MAKKKTTTKKASTTKSSAKTSAKSSPKKKATAKKSTKTKSKAATKKATQKSAAPAEDNAIVADPNDPIVEVERRETAERRQQLAGSQRRKVQRRRQIDPTTCERDYSNDEIEFMHAMDEYKRNNGRMFPTCSEILEVVRSIGYHKLPLGPDTPPVVTEPNDEQNADNECYVS